MIAPPERPSPDMVPVLFHVHGIGEYDFSSLAPGQLAGVQAEATRRAIEVVPTIFLRREWLDSCQALLARYAADAPLLPNILGFAIEGPLLGPEGGTPRAAAWSPSVDEWKRIAALGRLGLRYLVLAPDAMALDDRLRPGFRFADLVALLHDNGINVALGHFLRGDPDRSADRALGLIAYANALGGSRTANVLTDHLYNDMPRSFTHAWRGPDRERRDAELGEFLKRPWHEAGLRELLGAVPAALLIAARNRELLPCLNFDGAHVDLEICRRTVDFAGAENLIAITDHTECASMAGESLRRVDRSTLWYREDDVVAAGSQGVELQIRNLRAIGMTPHEVSLVLSANPRRIIGPGLRGRLAAA
jgi:N-acetylglucosamine-6-phosphate deacetylase